MLAFFFAYTLLSTATAQDWQCTPEKTMQNVKQFQNAMAKERHWSACASHDWLVRYAQLAEASNMGRQVIFDVGGNKGYESMNMFALFAPRAGANPPAAYHILTNASNTGAQANGNCEVALNYVSDRCQGSP